MLKKIYNSYLESYETNFCLYSFLEYIQNAIYYSLKTAFNEIRIEVEKVTK